VRLDLQGDESHGMVHWIGAAEFHQYVCPVRPAAC
jgi:hypothetical protein